MLVRPSSVIISSVSDSHTTAVLAKVSSDTIPLVLDFRNYWKTFNSTVLVGQCPPQILIRDKAGNQFDLSDVKTVWWRRPQRFVNATDLDAPVHQTFVRAETVSYWRGGLTLLQEARWYNHFDCDRLLDRKIYQLALAAKVGFNVPATCITSSPTLAHEFIENHSYQVIFKSFGGSEEFWQPARLYSKEAMTDLLTTLGRCPVIFQKFIVGEDYRVTIVDDAIFVASKDVRKTPYPFDVRITASLPYSKSRLNPQVEDLLLAFMRAGNLRYGAFDLRRDADGTFWFFEVNPAGQFLYIELQTGLPIAQKLGAALSAPASNTTLQIFPDQWCDDKRVFSIDVPNRVTHLR